MLNKLTIALSAALLFGAVSAASAKDAFVLTSDAYAAMDAAKIGIGHTDRYLVNDGNPVVSTGGIW